MKMLFVIVAIMSIARKSIKFNQVSAYQFFQMARLGTAILISILLVKTGYPKLDVSTFELFVFSANLFSFFWVMGIKNAALSYFPTLEEKDKRSFYFNSFLILQTLGLLFSVLLYFSLKFGLIENEGLNNGHIAFMLGAFLFFYAPTVLIELVYILTNKSKELFNYAIWIHLLQLTAVGFAAWLTHDLFYLFMVMLGWTVIKWLYTIWLVSKNTELAFNIGNIRQFLWFGIPIILHILLGNGMEFIDGILVNQFFDEDLFAIFRYGARELPFALILIAALSSTMIPIAVRHPGQAAAEIKQKTQRLMHIFFPLSIALIFLSPWLFRTFYSEQYMDAALLFNIYLLILASRIIMVEVFVYAAHLNKLLMFVSLGELLINIVFSLIFLQYWGLAGIAFATVISFMLSKIFLSVYMWLNKKISLSQYLNVPVYALYSVVLYLSFVISSLLE